MPNSDRAVRDRCCWCVPLTQSESRAPNNHTAFGRDVSWKEDTSMPPGHEMSYKDALHTATTNSLLKIIVPDWAMGLTKTLRDTKQAYDEIYVSLSYLAHVLTGHSMHFLL